MNRDDVRNLVHTIVRVYPSWKITDAKETVDAWSAFLIDEDTTMIGLALKQYIKTNTSGFPPSVGQLIQLARPQKVEVSALEVWGEVSRAIQNSAYNSIEEFDKLPDLAKKTIGNPAVLRSWAIDQEYNEGVVSSNFLKNYNTMKARQERYDGLIPELKALTEQTAELLEG